MGAVQIASFRYQMQMGGGVDLWRPTGRVFGHPGFGPGEHCWPSTPISLDEQKLTFITRSGREYQILSFEGDSRAILEQLKLDISHGGFEAH